MTTTAEMHKKEDFVAGFAPFAETRATEEPEWLGALRRTAIGHFDELGFPTLHHEDWRWTNLSAMTQTGFRPGQAAGLGDLPDGVTVGSLAGALRASPALLEGRLAQYAQSADRAFIALNTAFMADGLFVHVPDGMSVEKPIHVLHLSEVTTGASVSHPRHLIVAGAESSVTVIESYGSTGTETYLTNVVTEVVCGEKSRVSHTKVQRESESAFHVAALAIHQGTGSRFRSATVNLGGRLVRNEYHAYLGGEGADCVLNGLSMGHGHQVVDTHTRLDHAVPNCTSWQFFKSILDGKCRGIFDGRIHVHRDAQKTDAKQTARSLLLSDDAVSNNKPQLEIYADDVKCTHGATTGQLDDSQVFYLRARGLDLEAARSLLTYAFAREVADTIEIEVVRQQMERACLGRLPNGKAIEEIAEVI
jgi:Fe-S cluster assembly protein SufD